MKESIKYSDFIEFLNAGKICVFETDTVVGIGCKVFHEGKINKKIQEIFDIKKRVENKKLPWLISSTKMLNEYTGKINEYAIKIIEEKWPGATTLIFENSKKIPKELSVKENNESSSLAFRIPNNEQLICAIDFISCPIATTSANIAGQKAVFSVDDVSKTILNKVDFVYKKHFHKEENKKASEIISCLGEKPKIIRE